MPSQMERRRAKEITSGPALGQWSSVSPRHGDPGAMATSAHFARRTPAWGEHLRNQPVFFHIDSEAAKHSLIRGTCQQREVSAVLQLETQLCLRPWYSRIPFRLTQQGFDHQAVSNDSVLALVEAARGR